MPTAKPLLSSANVPDSVHGSLQWVSGPATDHDPAQLYIISSFWVLRAQDVRVHARLNAKIRPDNGRAAAVALAGFMGAERSVRLVRTAVVLADEVDDIMRLYTAKTGERRWLREDVLPWLGSPVELWTAPGDPEIGSSFVGLRPGAAFCAGLSCAVEAGHAACDAVLLDCAKRLPGADNADALRTAEARIAELGTYLEDTRQQLRQTQIERRYAREARHEVADQLRDSQAKNRELRARVRELEKVLDTIPGNGA